MEEVCLTLGGAGKGVAKRHKWGEEASRRIQQGMVSLVRVPLPPLAALRVPYCKPRRPDLVLVGLRKLISRSCEGVRELGKCNYVE